MTLLRDVLAAPMPDPVRQTLFDWIAQQETALRTGYEVYDKYYAGEHEVRLTDRLRKFLSPDLTFRDNFCETVVDAVVERLNVTGFAGQDEAIGAWAWETWQTNRMDLTQILVHTEAVVKGDAYLLVDWDAEAERPRFNFHEADLVTPRYNLESRQMEFAAKKWLVSGLTADDTQTRLNLYYPDRVEKYMAAGHVWTQVSDPGDTAWPVPWLDREGRPLGIPIVHFRNKPGAGLFGLSEIANVIPMQDLLNKTLVDLMMVLDTLGWPQRYTVGVVPPARYEVVPGAVWDFQADDSAEKAVIGQFPNADVTGILAAIEAMVQHIAGRSRTPQHLFHLTGGLPSGESLKIAESGLVHKVKQRQVAFGNAWEDAITIALRLQSAFGQRVGPEQPGRVETVWADPETRNEEAHLASLEAKSRLGVPHKQLWREMGYDDEEIEQMDADAQAQKIADTNIGEAILSSFAKGQGV